MQELERFKEEILKDYPRMSEEDSFKFACHPGVSCFNNCCGDVNIFLTPYDVIRLKNRLGISSQEFLDNHTILPFDKNLKYPAVLLRMNENEKKSCPFVAEDGCQVYEDRPWSCRMYPLGMASPQEGNPAAADDFYFQLKESVCEGHKEAKTQTVLQWLNEQGISEYNAMGAQFKDLVLHPFFQSGQNLTPQKVEMFFMICYNIDKFREFVFESSFLDKIEVDDETRKLIRADDVALLSFGYKWLRFAFFGEKTLTIKSDVRADKERELRMKQKLPQASAG